MRSAMISSTVRFCESTTAETEATTARDVAGGRILEAKGNDEAGNRVFRVRVIAYGDSKNGRRYPEAVMRTAVPLYEGAKAYDRHRDDAELRSSTVAGLVGSYRSVEASAEGLEADLHLLPSATHVAELLDASLAAQKLGLPPLVGISHDVLARYRPLESGGRRVSEATEVVKVNSADVVADPAAGGQAVRMVAGGTEGETGTGDTTPPELLHDRGTARGRAVIAQEATARGLPQQCVEGITKGLPERFSEAQLTAAIESVWSAVAAIDRAELRPTVTTQVTQESHGKKLKALDAFFTIDGEGGGYRTLREAYLDITGHRVRYLDEDLNRRVLADSYGTGFSSGMRSTESLNSTSWAEVLGDSVTRRLIAEYRRPSWVDWKQIVSAIEYGLDFRTQRRVRFGGYGLLPPVGQGAPYQPLPSPPDEEATYGISKRGGTEDLTLEMIANDDVSATRRIPVRLGRSAANTLYRFVFDILPTNAAVTYDSTALFHANHANTDNPAVLSNSTLSAGRRKMRKQAAYSDSADILSIVPKFLVVPSDLEEIAFQLTATPDAVPANSNDPADRANLHRGVQPIVVDYYTDQNDWYLVADPAQQSTIELGFYASSDAPELFTQSDQNNGSMFDADKMTFKIRHIYSGTVVDHRGFYRGAN
ncbi:MAG: hypothetical protein ACJ72N_14135 [Labedaea sp.]